MFFQKKNYSGMIQSILILQKYITKIPYIKKKYCVSLKLLSKLNYKHMYLVNFNMLFINKSLRNDPKFRVCEISRNFAKEKFRLLLY